MNLPVVSRFLINKIKFLKVQSTTIHQCLPYSSAGCVDLKARDLTPEMKHIIEKHWKDKLGSFNFNKTNIKDKFYVLSMFPYPSGHLHMGHVRVYSISDAMARFYRLQGKNVLHPMGWDAFGLPAENAALQRQIPADEWTKQNIQHMKDQLDTLGCSFDWECELATCNPDYYKWTQKLFLMLHEDGLAYQKEAVVNWDPVDKTVLADEQVDGAGCSWRSGAKVEKKLLRQWFVKTTKFAKNLLDGLDDPTLEEWRDIIKLQKHWIGECDGYNFKLIVEGSNNQIITVWTKNPEHLKYATFICVKKEHILNDNKIDNGLLKCQIKNPFNGIMMKVLVTDEVEFPPFNDSYIGVPAVNEIDRELSQKHESIEFRQIIDTETEDFSKDRQEILIKSQELKLGGDFLISSKLQDWLISRQRYWGTPIPIVHCNSCGAVPVKDEDLPVKIPESKGTIGKPLSQNEEWLKTACPKCGSAAKRESDTMDTFVDSSWYFLRYLDANNAEEMFKKQLGLDLMPVDLYIGGKEHAVLHLYYARFINHFLHSKGLVSSSEPFKRLLVQGMVMGKSFRVKGSGQYLKEDQVEILDAKKNKGVVKESGEAVSILWEKMSKSKLNGVDPVDVIGEHGCDTTRLIMLADVAPTSHRNWSSATFPGILNWQRRIWMTVHDFLEARNNAHQIEKTEKFDEQEAALLDSKNYFTSGATFNFKFSHQLSVAISRMQGLTNSIRRSPLDVMAHGKQYEIALASQIIMLSPLAPHFASELWSRLEAASSRVNKVCKEINWTASVFEQKWPEVDQNFQLELTFKVNNYVVKIIKIPRSQLDALTHETAYEAAMQNCAVVEYINSRQILRSSFVLYPAYEGIVNIVIDKPEKVKNAVKQ